MTPRENLVVDGERCLCSSNPLPAATRREHCSYCRPLAPDLPLVITPVTPACATMDEHLAATVAFAAPTATRFIGAAPARWRHAPVWNDLPVLLPALCSVVVDCYCCAVVLLPCVVLGSTVRHLHLPCNCTACACQLVRLLQAPTFSHNTTIHC